MEIEVFLEVEFDKWNQYSRLKSFYYLRSVTRITTSFLNQDLFKDKNKLQLSILLTNDSKIQEINKKFRQKDKPTNTLSFPFVERGSKDISNNFQIPSDIFYIGDLVFSLETLIKESKDENINIYYHFTHLFIHSLLHCFGYDHEEDSDAEIMENLEKEILLFMKNKGLFEV